MTGEAGRGHVIVREGEEELEPSQVLEVAGRFRWRLEYTLLVGVALMLTLFAIGFFYFSTDVSNLASYGYFGVFVISLVGAASILLPSPAVVSVLGGGALLNDFLGVPAWFWVGIVAGLGEAIGEFSGYAAGYGGRVFIEDRPSYARIRRWMERRGALTLFVMSTIPNPAFDLVGLTAGAVQMPMRRFFLSVLAGKTIKNMWLAGLASAGVTVFSSLA
ncbi:MAG: VTT domain-containing protein [Chloroflexi bacterium]|nr:VTT domain-containing protein [Chloroflexota bacterium]MCI0814566.1 VTT domain-containing protein [Chloroflexota bacterium]MCI0818168.1 VTT domain-containing protein [Chloroflexota bacterium]MCI0820447.1 VTT domain-containing protein [Chloroflexota bacterium]MCI0831200.1 VTT domain-containing protein [Chloroflexota bacterium]